MTERVSQQELARQRRVAKLVTALDLQLASEHLTETGEIADPITLLRLKRKWLGAGLITGRWRTVARNVSAFDVHPPSVHTCTLAEAFVDAQIQLLFGLDVRHAEEQAERL